MATGKKLPGPIRPPEPAVPTRGVNPTLLTVATFLLIAALSVFLLEKLGPILKPLFIAVALSYLIIPAHSWLTARLNISPWLATLTLTAAFVLLTYSLAGMLYQNVTALTQRVPAYVQRRDALIQRWWDFFDEADDADAESAADRAFGAAAAPVADASPQVAVVPPQPAAAPATRLADAAAALRLAVDAATGGAGETFAADPPEPDVAAARPSALPQAPRPGKRDVQQRLRELVSVERFSDYLKQALGTFFDFVNLSVVVLFYLVFILSYARTFPQRVAKAYGGRQSGHIMEVVAQMNRAIAQYLLVKVVVSMIVGTSTSLVLLAFGVDFYVMWGILAFFLNFIPYIGSVVASVLPIALAFLQFQNSWWAVAVAVLLIGAHQFTGNIVEPKMSSSRVGLSPLAILLAIAFWYSVWGVIGMIIAVPLLSSLKLVLLNLDATRPLALLIASDEETAEPMRSDLQALPAQ